MEVLARVKSEELRLVDAAAMLRISYRQVKRLWRRYQEEGAEGLEHRSAGRESNRGKPKKLRERVLRLMRKKYSGQPGERFGPTLAAEHLASEDGLRSTRRRCGGGCWRRGCGVGHERDGRTGNGGSGRRTSASWCNWTAASMSGWKDGGRRAA